MNARTIKMCASSHFPFSWWWRRVFLLSLLALSFPAQTLSCVEGTGDVCQNGGTCDDSDGRAGTCICTSGFTGVLCETPLSLPSCQTSDLDSPNGQVTFSTVDGPKIPETVQGGTQATLSCNDNWTPVTTDSFICAIGGDGVGSWSPQPPPGDFCEDADSCLSTPCLNGGTCDDMEGGFKCRCSPGNTGTTCDLKFDPCLTPSNPCLNGGTCTPNGNDYLCSCPSKYKGTTCANAKGETAIVNCELGYNLVGTGTYTCQDDATWSPDFQSRCQEITCPKSDLTSVCGLGNGCSVQFEDDDAAASIDDTATPACAPGFVPILNGNFVCRDNGRWDPTPTPPCEPRMDCDNDALVDAGSFKGGKVIFPHKKETTPAGESALVSCDPEYRLSGDVAYRCTPGGIWQPTFFNTLCEKVCPHGFILVTASGFDTCIYTSPYPKKYSEAEKICEHLGAALPVLRDDHQVDEVQQLLTSQGLRGDSWLSENTALDTTQLCFAAEPLFSDALADCEEIGIQPAGNYITNVVNENCLQLRRFAVCQAEPLKKKKEYYADTHRRHRRYASHSSSDSHFEHFASLRALGFYSDPICPRLFFAFGDECYWSTEERLSWALAERACASVKASLAMPKTQKELLDLQDFLSDTGRPDAWLGLRLYPEDDDNFCLSWFDGDPVSIPQAHRFSFLIHFTVQKLGMDLFCPGLQLTANYTLTETPRLRYQDCDAKLQFACVKAPQLLEEEEKLTYGDQSEPTPASEPVF